MKSRKIHPRGFDKWLNQFSQDNPLSINVKIFNSEQKAICMAAKEKGFKMTDNGVNIVRFEKEDELKPDAILDIPIR